MKRMLALAMTALLCLSLAACAASPDNFAAGSAPMAPPAAAPDYAESGGEVGYTSERLSRFDLADAGSPYNNESAKLIRDANLTLESLEYDAAVAALDALVARCGGYYGSSSFWGGNTYSGRANRSSEFTVRVPAERYEEFFAAVGGVAHVVHRSESTTDVGADYYDTELRLSTARVKHERLLSLLERADKMEDIITIETSLAQVQYEIDQLSGSLRRYDGLIGFATIHVSLSEVTRITDLPAERDTLQVRISKAFSGGVDRFGRSMTDLAEWAAYHFIGIVIFLVFIAVVAVFLRKKIFRKGRKNPPDVTG